MIFWKISISEYVLWFCRLNANDMDRALSGYEILVHVAKHSDAIITYADTLTVRASLLTALPHLCQDSHTIRTFYCVAFLLLCTCRYRCDTCSSCALQ